MLDISAIIGGRTVTTTATITTDTFLAHSPHIRYSEARHCSRSYSGAFANCSKSSSFPVRRITNSYHLLTAPPTIKLGVSATRFRRPWLVIRPTPSGNYFGNCCQTTDTGNYSGGPPGVCCSSSETDSDSEGYPSAAIPQTRYRTSKRDLPLITTTAAAAATTGGGT